MYEQWLLMFQFELINSRNQHYHDYVNDMYISLLVNNVESTYSFKFSVNHIDRNLPVSVMNFCTDNVSDIFLFVVRS